MTVGIPRGKGKYKGKLPIICFSCNKVCHIAARYLDREEKHERKERKYKGRKMTKTIGETSITKTKVRNLISLLKRKLIMNLIVTICLCSYERRF